MGSWAATPPVVVPPVALPVLLPPVGPLPLLPVAPVAPVPLPPPLEVEPLLFELQAASKRTAIEKENQDLGAFDFRTNIGTSLVGVARFEPRNLHHVQFLVSNLVRGSVDAQQRRAALNPRRAARFRGG